MHGDSRHAFFGVGTDKSDFVKKVKEVMSSDAPVVEKKRPKMTMMEEKRCKPPAFWICPATIDLLTSYPTTGRLDWAL